MKPMEESEKASGDVHEFVYIGHAGDSLVTIRVYWVALMRSSFVFCNRTTDYLC